MSTRTNNSGCLTAIAASFSRWFLIFFWIARPGMMNLAFNTFILPCLGFLFLPFTTLMYVLLVQGVGRIEGLDYLWLALGGRVDLASVRAAGGGQRAPRPAGDAGSPRASVGERVR